MGNWQDSFPARLEIGYKGSEAAAKMRSVREQMKLRSYGTAYNSDPFLPEKIKIRGHAVVTSHGMD